MTEFATPDGLLPLVAWAEGARAAHTIAQSLVRTSFVPGSLRVDKYGKVKEDAVVVGEITAAILTGQEIGMQPMASLRSIDIIDDTPALRAIAMRGLVQSAGHEVWVEGTPTKEQAVVRGRRKGSEIVQSAEWTIQRANELGVTRKKNGEAKDNWTKQAQNMLIARATSECCRLVAADVLLGVPYSVEELQDLSDSAVGVSAKKATAKRKPVEPPPEPELTDGDPDPLADVVIPLTVPEPDL